MAGVHVSTQVGTKGLVLVVVGLVRELALGGPGWADGCGNDYNNPWTARCFSWLPYPGLGVSITLCLLPMTVVLRQLGCIDQRPAW